MFASSISGTIKLAKLTCQLVNESTFTLLQTSNKH
jgi:hypothetical protein